jgi:hypothetical protein
MNNITPITNHIISWRVILYTLDNLIKWLIIWFTQLTCDINWFFTSIIFIRKYVSEYLSRWLTNMFEFVNGIINEFINILNKSFSILIANLFNYFHHISLLDSFFIENDMNWYLFSNISNILQIVCCAYIRIIWIATYGILVKFTNQWI